MDQMRYLHHRMQRCAFERWQLGRARQLAAKRPAAPAPSPSHLIRPLQVCSAATARVHCAGAGPRTFAAMNPSFTGEREGSPSSRTARLV